MKKERSAEPAVMTNSHYRSAILFILNAMREAERGSPLKQLYDGSIRQIVAVLDKYDNNVIGYYGKKATIRVRDLLHELVYMNIVDDIRMHRRLRAAKEPDALPKRLLDTAEAFFGEYEKEKRDVILSHFGNFPADPSRPAAPEVLARDFMEIALGIKADRMNRVRPYFAHVRGEPLPTWLDPGSPEYSPFDALAEEQDPVDYVGPCRPVVPLNGRDLDQMTENLFGHFGGDVDLFSYFLKEILHVPDGLYVALMDTWGQWRR